MFMNPFLFIVKSFTNKKAFVNSYRKILTQFSENIINIMNE